MRLKLFSLAFLVSLPFWAGVNILAANLEDFFFWNQLNSNPQLMTAHLASAVGEKERIVARNWQIPDVDISANAALAIFVSEKGQKVLYQKFSDKRNPVASLTKLMTALVAEENFDSEERIRISRAAVDTFEDFGKFSVGDVFYARQLLFPLLAESSNDAAAAITEKIGDGAFVELMNLTARNLSLPATFFVNPTGLDPENEKIAANYSTVADLAKLAAFIIEKEPLVKDAANIREMDFFTASGVLHHKIINNNELLADPDIPWKPKIIFTKTGWTPFARGCMIIALKTSNSSEYILSVILGAEDRAFEMKKLINWIYSAYSW